jgi:hypothetical protein
VTVQTMRAKPKYHAQLLAYKRFLFEEIRRYLIDSPAMSCVVVFAFLKEYTLRLQWSKLSWRYTSDIVEILNLQDELALNLKSKTRKRLNDVLLAVKDKNKDFCLDKVNTDDSVPLLISLVSYIKNKRYGLKHPLMITLLKAIEPDMKLIKDDKKYPSMDELKPVMDIIYKITSQLRDLDEEDVMGRIQLPSALKRIHSEIRSDYRNRFTDVL